MQARRFHLCEGESGRNSNSPALRPHTRIIATLNMKPLDPSATNSVRNYADTNRGHKRRAGTVAPIDPKHPCARWQNWKDTKRHGSSGTHVYG